MRFKKSIVLFLILFGTIVFGQKTNDSLLQALKKHTERDHFRCAILRELRKNAVRSLDYDLADRYDAEAGEIALENLKKKITNKKLIKQYKQFYADALSVEITYYDNKNDYKNVIYYINRALKLHYEVDSKDDIGYDLMQLGNANSKFGFIEKATENYFKSIFYLKKRQGIVEEENNYLCYIYDKLTKIYSDNGDYKRAIEFQFEKLKITNTNSSQVYFNQKINLQNRAYCYLQIGTAYSKQGEKDQAFKYFYKAIKLFKTIQYDEGLAFVYQKISLAYYANNEMQKAILFIKASQKSTSNVLLKIQNNIVLSDIYIHKNKIDSAYNFSIKALKNLEYSKTPFENTTIYQNLAAVYFRKGDYNKALSYAKKSIAISQRTRNLEVIQNSNKLLYQIYKLQNKNKEALYFLEKANQFKDSINRKENQNVILKADFNYQTEKKEAKIKDLNQKKKISELESNKKSILINNIVISFLLLVLISCFLFYRFKEKKKNELLQTQLFETQKRLEAEKKATESELKALKSQMNPHFIFNALNSIQEQFMYGDKLKGNEQLSNFTYLTRQILEVSGKKQITIATEIDILTKYLELEKMRFAKDFEYFITTSDSIDEDYLKLPPMLIQPFIENSIKHGLMHKIGKKIIEIDFDLSVSEEYIICTIIDNGIGRQKSAEIKAKNQNNHLSFSTASIEQRLELLNENLKLNHLVVYEDVVANEIIVGTKVVVNIPLV